VTKVRTWFDEHPLAVTALGALLGWIFAEYVL
jgi:hypothetical protein